MRKILISLLCTTMLSACDTMTYTPTEYPLRAGLIPGFDVAGTVTVSNSQPSISPVIVYSHMGTQMGANLNAITETMVQQAHKELLKNGRKTSSAGPSKVLAIKVNSLVSEFTEFFWKRKGEGVQYQWTLDDGQVVDVTAQSFWKSNIQFQATLGNGEVIEFTVPHASGSPLQDLNGCIAEGVKVLFKDERIKAYLAS